MAKIFRLVDTTPEILSKIAENARKEELDEVVAVGDKDMLSALQRSNSDGIINKAAVDEDGTVICAFGITKPDEDGYFGAWFLGTNEVPKHMVKFVKSCKAYTPVVLKYFPKIRALIDSRYEASLNWIQKVMGFSVKKDSHVTEQGIFFSEVEINTEKQEL